jgi:hypothetical protein
MTSGALRILEALETLEQPALVSLSELSKTNLNLFAFPPHPTTSKGKTI